MTDRPTRPGKADEPIDDDKVAPCRQPSPFLWTADAEWYAEADRMEHEAGGVLAVTKEYLDGLRSLGNDRRFIFMMIGCRLRCGASPQKRPTSVN